MNTDSPTIPSSTNQQPGEHTKRSTHSVLIVTEHDHGGIHITTRSRVRQFPESFITASPEPLADRKT